MMNSIGYHIFLRVRHAWNR
uniref:Uncharacterized protein MANES_02G147400 n=1 Tax=Rhizophora mucronata TaxID=61149 RepID=A0A2P2LFB5_RHIMU